MDNQSCWECKHWDGATEYCDVMDRCVPEDDWCSSFTERPDQLPAKQPEVQVLADAAKQIQEMAGQMRLLADMLRVTNARMGEMEKVIRTLEKVTPRQAAEINARIRQRAAEV